jgi:plasmid maintenance system antidote protein VapI
VQTIRNQIALNKMGVSQEKVMELMQGENGLSAARIAQLNKEIGQGSDLDLSESEDYDVAEMLQNMN